MGQIWNYRLEYRGSEIEVAAGEVTVGRSKTCDITISDASVSRRHLVLTATAGKLILKDLGSSNGTFINGNRIAGGGVLHNGDTLGLGDARLVAKLTQEVEEDQAAFATVRMPIQDAPGDATAFLQKASVELAKEALFDEPPPPAPAGVVFGAPAAPEPPAPEAAGPEAEPSHVAATAPPKPEPPATPPPPADPMVRPPAPATTVDVRADPMEPAKTEPARTIPLPVDPPSPPAVTPQKRRQPAPPPPAVDPPSPAVEPPAPAHSARPNTPVDPIDPRRVEEGLPGGSSAGELLPSLDDLDTSMFGRPSKKTRESQKLQRKLPPAGFLVRFAALFFDALWSGGLSVSAALLAGELAATAASGVSLVVILVGWSVFGTTPGKRVLGLYVCTLDGRAGIGLGRSLLRVLGYVVATIPLGAGFLRISWSKDRRGLHDLVAGTYVGRRRLS